MVNNDKSYLNPIEIVEATDDLTQEQIKQFYSLYPEKTLKTLIFKCYSVTEEEFIVFVLDGSRKVDISKIKVFLGLKKVRFASVEELINLGLVPGYISPIDCTNKGMKVIGDVSITKNYNYYDGGNKEKRYRKNVNFPRDFQVWKLLEIGQ